VAALQPRDYAVAVERLYNKTGDKELATGFSLVDRLYLISTTTSFRSRGFQLHREGVLILTEISI
jgi:hypothetical protein